MKRIEKKFLQLKQEGKSAFIPYICAGYPNLEKSFEILKMLPKAGADIIEIGIPFLDPSGDGPIIESASKVAISEGATVAKILKMIEKFRKEDNKTPIILMTYFNPILKFGINKIFYNAVKSGVDGILIVDLPTEEEDEILQYVKSSNIDLIKLIAPTSDNERIKKIAKNSSGFLYLISMLGITGTSLAKIEENKKNLNKIRKISNLPIAIGFGIKNYNQAKDFASLGFDGVIIGSKIVEEISKVYHQKDYITQLQDNISKFANNIHNKNK